MKLCENPTIKDALELIRYQLEKGTTKPNKKVINALREEIRENIEEINNIICDNEKKQVA